MNGHVLITVREGRVQRVRVGRRPGRVPWADGVEVSSDGGRVLLRSRCVEGPVRGEQVITAGQALCLGGHATSCLDLALDEDPSGHAVRLGPDLISRSEPMIRTLHQTVLAASVRDPVLVIGESGTGKELVARALHDLAANAQPAARTPPFVAVNMGAIPEDLAEAQLFGWLRGAFTGAVEARPGAFEAAQDGILFLDEIGEAPLAVQAKLLRAVESRVVCRLGSVQPVPVRARLVAATHRDLRLDVAARRFRLDLFERLACVVIHVPPLRARLADLPLLAQRLAQDLPGSPPVTPEAFEVLKTADWPGNVRSLRNVLTRAAMQTLGGPLTAWAIREALAGSLPVEGVREPRLTRASEIERSGLPRSTYYYRLRRGLIPSG